MEYILLSNETFLSLDEIQKNVQYVFRDELEFGQTEKYTSDDFKDETIAKRILGLN